MGCDALATVAALKCSALQRPFFRHQKCSLPSCAAPSGSPGTPPQRPWPGPGLGPGPGTSGTHGPLRRWHPGKTVEQTGVARAAGIALDAGDLNVRINFRVASSKLDPFGC